MTEPVEHQRAELRALDASIAAARAWLRDAPGHPVPGRPGELSAPARTGAADAATAVAQRLAEDVRRGDLLRRRLRDLELGRIDRQGCERAALAWLRAVASPQQLLAELMPDPARPAGVPPPSARPDALRIARRILAVRDRQLEGRLARLDDLRELAGIDAAWLADLLYTGCTLVPAPAVPDLAPADAVVPTVGVLLPLRIETRFDPGRLRLRVIPDEPWLVRHDARTSAGELDALERAFAAMRAAPTVDAEKLAWRQFCAQVGGARAVWLMRTFVQTGPDGVPTVVRPADDALRAEPAFPRLTALPRRLLVWLARAGGDLQHVLTLEIDHALLAIDPADPDSGERRWWQDWQAAVDAGLAGEIGLDGDPGDIDLLAVTGLSEDEPGPLFSDHRDLGGLGLLAPGTPTNTVDGAPAASRGEDPDEWYDVLQTPASATDRLVSQALTGDPDLLGNLPGSSEPHREWASAMVAGLWPALWGFAGDDVWGAVPATANAADWAPHALFPEGPFPTLRVGPQPYGLLPATSLRRWQPATTDPPIEPGLPPLLLLLRDAWRDAARSRGTVAGGSVERLLDLLAHVPTAPGYRQRRAWPLETWWLALLLAGFPLAWNDLDELWSGRYTLAGDLGLAPARRYGARAAPSRIELPLVRPHELPEDVPVGDVLAQLASLALDHPALFANPAVIEREQLRLGSVLLRLALRSLQVALGDVGRELLRDPPPGPEPLARPDGVPGRLERWLAAVTPQALAADTPATRALLRANDGLRKLHDVPEDRLEKLLRATLDTAIYRVDPWTSALPARRLQDLLDGPARDLRVGAYGWADAPRPGNPGPTAAGIVHAPSAPQALTAAVLRDRAVADPDTARWHMDLTSRRVRDAERIAQHVRLGAHPAEAVGREVERVVGDPDDIDRLRRNFPVRIEHGGRRTCDGLAILATDPIALGLTDDALAGLDALREAIDAFGDLLVAEAVHDVTQGRPDAAGAALDAAAGLSRPPALDVLRTGRDGRAVATSVLALLAAVASAPPPADALDRAGRGPSGLADPSVAAFVEQQVGDATTWRWDVEPIDGPPGVTIVLGGLGLRPADALNLPLADLTRLAAEAGAAALGRPAGDVHITAADGSARYERAARLVGLLGRTPAGPDAVSATPDTAGASAAAAAVDADLLARYTELHATAQLLLDLLTTQLGLTVAGELGGADAGIVRRLVGAARGWGIAPDPLAASAPGDPLVATAARAAEILSARLTAAPPVVDATALARSELVDVLARLVSPTGQLAVLSRLAAGTLPQLRPAGPGAAGGALDDVWLPVIAAVRDPLARLEAHQLAAATPAGSGPALSAWSTRPADPWQQDHSDARPLVVAYASGGLDLAAVPASSDVAAAVIDRFTETIPAGEQTTHAVFGFDAPAARAPQAILLAVPPDLQAPLDEQTIRDIVAETRELAHARMARPRDLTDSAHGLLPTSLIPALGRTAVPLDPPKQ